MTVRALGSYFTAGFRRYATYRLATAAGAFTNTVFGLIKAAVLVAATGAAGTASATGEPGRIAGYTALDASTYAWFTQALVAPVYVFAWNELALRVRTGDVAIDLARPVDLQLSWLAADLGRAAYELLPRALPPLVVGALTFGLVVPGDPLTYALGMASVVLAVTVSFAGRFAISLVAFWLVDIRGVIGTYAAVSLMLSGLLMPLSWFPGWLLAVARATPFPSMIQAPVDILTGRATGWSAVETLAVQGFWVVVTLTAGRLLLRLATRRLVIQGG